MKAQPSGGIDYLHSYHSSRPRVDWNRCGQAAVATLLDYHGLDPYGLEKPIYDEKDGHHHWVSGEIIDRICEEFPPDRLFGLFGTTPGQLAKALRSAGLEVSWAASRNERAGRRKIWKEVKRSVEVGLPVIVIMDMGTLGGRPLSAHWGVVYRIKDSIVYLANTLNATTVPEARFLRAFKCWFMPPRSHHCAVFVRPKTVQGPIYMGRRRVAEGKTGYHDRILGSHDEGARQCITGA